MTTPAVLARRGLRVLALLVLAVAVVAMHSLGVGHIHLAPAQAGTGPSGHATGLTMSATGHHGDEPVVVAAAPTLAVAAAAPGSRAACGDDCRPAAGSMAGHLVGAMCLAVLSALLVLLLLLALRTRGGRNCATANGHWRRLVAPLRGPPRRLALSLAQVCVLRT